MFNGLALPIRFVGFSEAYGSGISNNAGSLVTATFPVGLPSESSKLILAILQSFVKNIYLHKHSFSHLQACHDYFVYFEVLSFECNLNDIYLLDISLNRLKIQG